MTTINMTASTLRAILCYIAPQGTPYIAFDKDEMAKSLYERITIAVGEQVGSESVSISFNMTEEKELYRQFKGVALEIGRIFNGMVFDSDKELINNK